MTDEKTAETTSQAAVSTTWVDELYESAKNDQTLLALIAEFKDQLVKFTKAEFAAIIDRVAAKDHAEAMKLLYSKLAPDELHGQWEKVIGEWQELNAQQKAMRDSILATCERILGLVAKVITVGSCLAVFL